MHIPVLLKEVLEVLSPKDGEVYVDVTFGNGGYTEAILNSAHCKVIAIDRDETVLERAFEFKKKYASRFEFFHSTFSNIDEILKEKVDGIVADFGVSSMQLDTESRGFSFLKEAKLDMKMGIGSKLSAFHIVNSFSEPELVEIIAKYGEERLAKKIANFITRERAKKEITTTLELAKIVEEAYGKEAKFTKIHPATKTFQALRIFINDELFEIETLLEKSLNLLNSGGRLVCVSFHSLEDSIVKNFLNENSEDKKKQNKYSEFSKLEIRKEFKPFKLITNGAMVPTEAEIKANIRSRSAKLRGAAKQ